MPELPGSLTALLTLLRPAFTAPSFETLCALVVGFVSRVGEHTVTGMWQAARLAGVVHHSRWSRVSPASASTAIGARLARGAAGRAWTPRRRCAIVGGS